MTGPAFLWDLISAFAGAVAARPLFWAALAAMGAAVTVAALQFFEQPKRWLRGAIAAFIAVECFWLLNTGWL